MSKYRFKVSSIYYEGTNVPRNKLGIRDAEEIHEAENALLAMAYDQAIKQLNKNTVLDEAYFIRLHRATFESLYDFAGLYRDVNMAKGDSHFCLAQHLHAESRRIFGELADERYLRDAAKDHEIFARRLAYYQCELIALHPFYELNGRITRLFIDLLALRNGYAPIDYAGAIDDEAYIEASIACVRYADPAPLERIISGGLRRNAQNRHLQAFERAEISLGQLSKLLNLTKEETMKYLTEREIPVTDYAFEEDLQEIKKLSERQRSTNL
jgi:cell filamentation protein